MNPKSEFEKYLRHLPSDSSFLAFDLETERFFKAETGIQDTEELRKHIIEVQEEAYKASHCRVFANCGHRPGVTLFPCPGFPVSLYPRIQIC